jgi:hypothetical protein
MAIEPLVRIPNRLTSKNFIDAEQLDFDFNALAIYLNTKIIPSIATLANNFIKPDATQANIGKYLYENEVGNLSWRAIEERPIALNTINAPNCNLAIVGQEANESNLKFLPLDFIKEGLVQSKNNISFDNNNVALIVDEISNDYFEDNTITRVNLTSWANIQDNIFEKKLKEYNDLTELILDVDDGISAYFTLSKTIPSRCIKQGSITNEFSNANRPVKMENYNMIFTIPSLTFGNSPVYKFPLPTDKISLNWQSGFRQLYKNGNNYQYFRWNRAIMIKQDVSSSDDYATEFMLADDTLSTLFLTLTPNEIYGTSMHLPARCFADKCIGISGQDMDSRGQERINCIPYQNEKLATPENEKQDKYYHPYMLFSTASRGVSYVNNRCTITVDHIENGIIDKTFFSKKIQDKIDNAEIL